MSGRDKQISERNSHGSAIMSKTSQSHWDVANEEGTRHGGRFKAGNVDVSYYYEHYSGQYKKYK